MREILFRGKTEDGKWVDGFYVRQVDCCGGVHFIFHCANNPDDSNARYDVIKETVGQFTGSTDKNGKKIFEGDIIKNTFEEGSVEFLTVVWNGKYCCFELKEHMSKELIELCEYEEGEVIGNIHDNPELEKEKDND